MDIYRVYFKQVTPYSCIYPLEGTTPVQLRALFMPPNSGNGSPQHQLHFQRNLKLAKTKPITNADVKRIQSSKAKETGEKTEKNSFVARIQSVVDKREN